MHGVTVDVSGRVTLCDLVGAGTAETLGNGLHSPGLGLRKQPGAADRDEVGGARSGTEQNDLAGRFLRGG